MHKKLLYRPLFFLSCLAYGQECPKLTEPLDGAGDVPVDTSVTW